MVFANITDVAVDMRFLERKLGISHSTLYRRVRRATGMSVNEYVRGLRLENVTMLLGDGYSVSEAAYRSGFNDIPYFRSCFKERYGILPSLYRRGSGSMHRS